MSDKKFYVYRPHLDAFMRVVAPHLRGASGEAPIVSFQNSDELKGAPEGVLVVMGSDPASMPSPVFERARDAGLVVWHVSESYAKAKAEKAAAEQPVAAILPAQAEPVAERAKTQEPVERDVADRVA